MSYEKDSNEIGERMKPCCKVLYHENSNVMAVVDCSGGGLPLLTIVDDDVKMINPFYSYPLRYLLEYYGWIEIGEL